MGGGEPRGRASGKSDVPELRCAPSGRRRCAHRCGSMGSCSGLLSACCLLVFFRRLACSCCTASAFLAALSPIIPTGPVLPGRRLPHRRHCIVLVFSLLFTSGRFFSAALHTRVRGVTLIPASSGMGTSLRSRAGTRRPLSARFITLGRMDAITKIFKRLRRPAAGSSLEGLEGEGRSPKRSGGERGG
jgi:hypothetical protein